MEEDDRHPSNFGHRCRHPLSHLSYKPNVKLGEVWDEGQG